MTNEQVLEKMSKDMQMRNFSYYTYYWYMHKGKEILIQKKLILTPFKNSRTRENRIAIKLNKNTCIIRKIMI